MLNPNPRRGMRIVFSCTWKEKKKNAIETLKRHSLNVLRLGRIMVATTEGMEKKMQATEVIIVKKPIGKILSHFMTMLVTHQNVAT